MYILLVIQFGVSRNSPTDLLVSVRCKLFLKIPTESYHSVEERMGELDWFYHLVLFHPMGDLYLNSS